MVCYDDNSTLEQSVDLINMLYSLPCFPNYCLPYYKMGIYTLFSLIKQVVILVNEEKFVEQNVIEEFLKKTDKCDVF
jgi:hypothetical protein